MGLIAFLLLGLIAALILNILLPAERLIDLLGVAGIGMVGALFGGMIGAWFFEIQMLDRFYAVGPWVTAIFGATISLMTYSLYVVRDENVLRGQGSRPPRG